MDFFLIDKDEFSLNGTKMKLGKRIVRYEVFDNYDIVVLLVSNTDDWENTDEIIAIKFSDCTYQTVWSYQRKDATGTIAFRIFQIWKEKRDGYDRIACLILAFDLGFFDETNIIDVESGKVVKTEFSK